MNDPFKTRKRFLIKHASDSAMTFLQDERIRLELLIGVIDDLEPDLAARLRETRKLAIRRLIQLELSK